MGRIANEYAVLDPAEIAIAIHEQPIKTNGAEVVALQQLENQAHQAIASLVPVDYETARGTCSDERFRKQLRNGQPTEPRPAVFGGPDIYGLAIAELTGYFEAENQESDVERAETVKRQLNRSGVKSGGHDGCAANALFAGWMELIATKSELAEYAQSQLGDRYDASLAQEVVDYASSLVQSGRYAAWKESNLADVYGEEAAEAIEQLGPVNHEAVTLVRNKINGTTVDQTELYSRSQVGKGSFIFDDSYADKLEHILSSGPDAVRTKLLAEHAREFIIAALVVAVPNEELYQIDLLAA